MQFDDRPGHRRTPTLFAVLGVFLLCVVALATPEHAHAALQKIAGYKKDSDSTFKTLFEYFANLRDAILPLSIPIGAIGLVIGGGMFLFGSHHAARTLFGVILGLGLILMAPALVA